LAFELAGEDPKEIIPEHSRYIRATIDAVDDTVRQHERRVSRPKCKDRLRSRGAVASLIPWI